MVGSAWPMTSASSPRSWGCFLFPPIRQLGHGVFPTLVGVFLLRDLDAPSPFGLPHARGGVSAKAVTAARHLASSPRSWGCFPAAPALPRVGMVFPTLVGVFLQMKVCSMIGEGLPHARGGVSNPYDVSRCGKGSSPRSWGCFFCFLSCSTRSRVFPTLVGVFHECIRCASCLRSLPHARGGVSVPGNGQGIQTMSSPRSWGCFRVRAGSAGSDAVFPTLVGVFRTAHLGP